jgi:hypothetical protein
MESFVPNFHQKHYVFPLNSAKDFEWLHIVLRKPLVLAQIITYLTWGSVQDPWDVIVFGRTAIFPGFGEDDEEATDDTLGLLALAGCSSSIVGLGGVGVRRSCVNIAIGAIFSASRCRNP